MLLFAVDDDGRDRRCCSGRAVVARRPASISTPSLKQSGRSGVGGARPRVRNLLAAAELGLATVLLIAAALLIQTLYRLQRTDLGFEPKGVLTFQLAPPASRNTRSIRKRRSSIAR